jgi:predicted MFS family arabinose efflux permease
LVIIAVAGFLTSLAIPKSDAVSPGQRLDWKPWTSTLDNLRAAKESRSVLLSVLGMSWFWFYGALVLVQLPLYCHNVLHGDESLVTVTIVAFSIGVGVGSLLCERLSGRQVEIGLVPFGSIGLTVFALDWVVASPQVDPHVLLNLHGLLALHGGVRTLCTVHGRRRAARRCGTRQRSHRIAVDFGGGAAQCRGGDLYIHAGAGILAAIRVLAVGSHAVSDEKARRALS